MEREMKMKIIKDKFKSGIGLLHLSRGTYLTALAFSLIALPAWAAHSDSFSWEIHEPTAIGNVQVEPGNYLFRAKEGQSELQIIKDAKVIAKVPCRWTHLTNRASSSEVKTLDNEIIQLQFAGRREAIQFNQ
jgi:hypothetical protein